MTDEPTRRTLEELERARRLEQTVQVLGQPHRRGYDGDMADSLGVFVRGQSCGRECYDAGWQYFRLKYRWRRAKGIPNPVRLDEMINSAGGEMDAAEVEELTRQINGCENAMKCSGLPGFVAAQDLLLDGKFPQQKHFGPVKCALLSLAIELGKFPF